MVNTKWLYNVASLLLIVATCNSHVFEPPPCEVFCKGEIIDVVQKSGVFKDSKTFVDMKMNFDHKTVLSYFKIMMNETGNKPKKLHIRRFLKSCFTSPGQECDYHLPEDWIRYPKFLQHIRDVRLKKWAFEIHLTWRYLCKIIKTDVRDESDLYSMLYVPNPIIVSGDRFREFYYWDTYWIIIGLLRSEMYITTKGILENLLLLVQKYGYVPNGGRIYYLNRSQPPLLLPMVQRYYEVTKDINFVVKHIKTLEKEFNFWMDNRVMKIEFNGRSFKLARYCSEYTRPRPEAYIEDLDTTKMMSEEMKISFYEQIASVCESGWSFSSRWYIRGGNREGNVTDTNIKSIIPVDLNAIICWNANILSFFYTLIKENHKAELYKDIANSWQEAIEALLWSEIDGAWFDYDFVAKRKRTFFYGSNLFPLWTHCYDSEKHDSIALSAVRYLENIRILEYEGGVPISMLQSGLHWDYPNSFPPIQYAIVMGLVYTENRKAQEFAFQLAHKWVRAVFKGYLTEKVMYDYYNALHPGSPGSGIHYAPQVGFGWTNGICIELLTEFGLRVNSHGVIKDKALRLTLPMLSEFICLLIIYI